MNKQTWLCLAICLFSSATTYAQATSTEAVQQWLQRLDASYPGLVGFIPETQRYYLVKPRRDVVPETWVASLQDAFFADIHQYCQAYGALYLADWRALASKTARETFWGTSYLCNRTFNYFGLRRKAKPWLCESFGYCDTLVRNDPEPAGFTVFPSFEASLWMFIHTIYNDHFLERLPDQGYRVVEAIYFERANGTHYWETSRYGLTYAPRLVGAPYTTNELIATWSGYPINNLCINCSFETDKKWVHKVVMADVRSRGR